MRRDTGFVRNDAENDFQRQRRRQVLSRLATWLRREPDDVNVVLPFDEVVAALGRTGEQRLGLQVIRLDSVVGSVDRTRDFDRYFRPTHGRVRQRWERLAMATRRGEAIPRSTCTAWVSCISSATGTTGCRSRTRSRSTPSRRW